jgi:hypothetical protein
MGPVVRVYTVSFDTSVVCGDDAEHDAEQRLIRYLIVNVDEET